MMLKTFFILTPLLSFCTLLSTNAQPINKTKDLSENALLYALPQTLIHVDIEYTKTTYVKGVFADYAEKFLNQKPEIPDNKLEYSINKIEITPTCQADPNKYFVLVPDKGEIKFDAIRDLVNQQKIFVDGGNTFLQQSLHQANTIRKQAAYIAYESLQKDLIDTTYKMELRDTIWVKVPYYERTYMDKTIEDHAREAAEVIISTNFKRLKAMDRLDPIDEYNPQVSDALFTETHKILQEYKTFFHGSVYRDTFSYNATILPVVNEKGYPICYFSTENGLSASKKSANEITLNLYLSIKNDSLKSLEESYNKTNNKLYYCIPANVNYSIEYANEILSSGIISIHQYGNIFQYPSRMVINK